jgi:hypothetical protein
MTSPTNLFDGSSRSKVTFIKLENGEFAAFGRSVEYLQKEDTICFAQNFEPSAKTYDNLRVDLTHTGKYKYQGKDFRVARAYHPNYTLDGVPVLVSGDILDVIDHKLNKKSIATPSPFSSLATLKAQLKVQKVLLRPNMKSFDTCRLSASPKIGDNIVRPVNFYTTGEKEFADMDDVPFEATEHNGQTTYMFKAMTSFSYYTNNRIIGDASGKGAVCFCKKDIPKDCIGFKVTGISKNGKTLFVEPMRGDITMLINLYYDVPRE